MSQIVRTVYFNMTRVIIVRGDIGPVAKKFLMDAIRSLEHPKIGVATGSTPESLYKLLAADDEARSIFQRPTTRVVALDEYNPEDGVSAEEWSKDPRSYGYFYWTKLEEPMGLPRGTVLRPTRENVDYFEDGILQGIPNDVALWGIGQNGHGAFNEPGSDENSATRIVDLAESTIAANAAHCGGDLKNVPRQAATRGLGPMLKDKKIILLASGEKKRWAVEQSLYFPPTPTCPVSYLQKHPDVIYIVDEAAAPR
jgi:glucosamine-6-phosphate deaminase